MTDPQRHALPELCMMLHMEFTGASQDMALAEVRACAEHVSERVATWKMHSNHERYLAFDTAVLSLCLATLAEFKEWQTRFPVVGIIKA